LQRQAWRKQLGIIGVGWPCREVGCSGVCLL